MTVCKYGPSLEQGRQKMASQEQDDAFKKGPIGMLVIDRGYTLFSADPSDPEVYKQLNNFSSRRINKARRNSGEGLLDRLGSLTFMDPWMMISKGEVTWKSQMMHYRSLGIASWQEPWFEWPSSQGTCAMKGRENQHIDYLQVLLRSCTSLSLLYALVATCGVMAHGAKTPENFVISPGVGDKCSTWEVGYSWDEFGKCTMNWIMKASHCLKSFSLAVAGGPPKQSHLIPKCGMLFWCCHVTSKKVECIAATLCLSLTSRNILLAYPSSHGSVSWRSCSLAINDSTFWSGRS